MKLCLMNARVRMFQKCFAEGKAPCFKTNSMNKMHNPRKNHNSAGEKGRRLHLLSSSRKNGGSAHNIHNISSKSRKMSSLGSPKNNQGRLNQGSLQFARQIDKKSINPQLDIVFVPQSDNNTFINSPLSALGSPTLKRNHSQSSSNQNNHHSITSPVSPKQCILDPPVEVMEDEDEGNNTQRRKDHNKLNSHTFDKRMNLENQIEAIETNLETYIDSYQQTTALCKPTLSNLASPTDINSHQKPISHFDDTKVNN